MHKLRWCLSFLLLLTTLVSACSASAVEPKSVDKSIKYQDVLGKSITDTAVLNFINDNNCSSTDTDQFQLCNDMGIMLWVNSSRVVQTVYLYLNNAEGFSGYKGKLPFGLKSYDIMEAVEYKLGRQGIGNDGLPDEGSSPDHFHYWAVYKQAHMIIVYDSPIADGDAMIHAILVSK